jgi:hypothetical protein
LTAESISQAPLDGTGLLRAVQFGVGSVDPKAPPETARAVLLLVSAVSLSAWTIIFGILQTMQIA